MLRITELFKKFRKDEPKPVEKIDKYKLNFDILMKLYDEGVGTTRNLVAENIVVKRLVENIHSLSDDELLMARRIVHNTELQKRLDSRNSTQLQYFKIDELRMNLAKLYFFIVEKEVNQTYTWSKANQVIGVAASLKGYLDKIPTDLTKLELFKKIDEEEAKRKRFIREMLKDTGKNLPIDAMRVVLFLRKKAKTEIYEHINVTDLNTMLDIMLSDKYSILLSALDHFYMKRPYIDVLIAEVRELRRRLTPSETCK